MLSEKALAELDEVMTRYPTKRAAILPALHLLQQEHGHISAEAEEWVAEKLELAPVKVHEVTTFYTMLHTEPVGRFHLQVCRTLSCQLRGCDEILAHLKDEHGVGNHDVGEDGRFSVEEVECLGACSEAPVVQVNDDYHKCLTLESFQALLEELATKDGKG